MNFLFLAALILAIPTYGLSLLFWFVLLVIFSWRKANARMAGAERMRSVRNLVEPLIGGRASDFYRALDVPKVIKNNGGSYEETCGQHIVNFISHNAELTNAFTTALGFHKIKGSARLPTAIEALKFEQDIDGGPMHHLCYFSIVQLQAQNGLACFADVDLLFLKRRMLQIERSFSEMTGYAR